MIYLDLKDKMSIKALNYSLSFVDKVFDSSVKGYIKVDLISKYLEIAREHDLGLDERVVYYIDENYDINDDSIMQFLNKKIYELTDTEYKEKRLVKGTINYLTEIMQSMKYNTNAVYRKKALKALQNDLGITIMIGEEDAEDIYNIYVTEAARSEEEKSGQKLSYAKIG